MNAIPRIAAQAAWKRRWPPEAKEAFTPVDATMHQRSPDLMCLI